MRLDRVDQEALAATLSSSGFHHGIDGVACLAFSAPTMDGNRAVHLQANEKLLDVLVRDEPGPCYHVTGEMRALADPFHRRLCAELARRADRRFTVIYSIPEAYRTTPEGVGRWNAISWRSKSWTDKISALNLIGDAIVDVRAYDTLNEVQYSVFGNRYVLLQEKHTDEAQSNAPLAKRVWLLESSRLNEHLTDRAARISGAAHDIPETLFRRFSARVNGITSRLLLNSLETRGGQAPVFEVMSEAVQAFDPDASQILEDLVTIGFVSKVSEESYCLAQAGGHYLRTVTARHPAIGL